MLLAVDYYNVFEGSRNSCMYTNSSSSFTTTSNKEQRRRFRNHDGKYTVLLASSIPQLLQPSTSSLQLKNRQQNSSRYHHHCHRHNNSRKDDERQQQQEGKEQRGLPLHFEQQQIQDNNQRLVLFDVLDDLLDVSNPNSIAIVSHSTEDEDIFLQNGCKGIGGVGDDDDDGETDENENDATCTTTDTAPPASPTTICNCNHWELVKQISGDVFHMKTRTGDTSDFMISIIGNKERQKENTELATTT